VEQDRAVDASSPDQVYFGVENQYNYGLSEEAHLILIHILTQYLKNELAGRPDERVPV
jgi:hypothetical protein